MLNILITGSSKGIGKYLYQSLKKENNVIGISRSKSPTTTFTCDISSEKDLKRVIKKIKKIDILINNASITNVSKNIIRNFEKTILTNLNGTFYSSHISLSKLAKSKNASIINISSINAHIGFPNNPGYVASKGGVNSLTRALSLDYAKYNIRVNSISLGYISSGMSQASFFDKRKKKIREKNTILNKWGSESDVLNAVEFFMNKKSKYITGTDLIVDGGWLAKGIK
jgi:NAD(P)-dependent dehydrogenase (short-subunit alcohol dehydrogenase family)